MTRPINPPSDAASPAYTFEDRTGVIGDSDFNDIYDRKFMRICKIGNTVSIFDLGFRSSTHPRRNGAGNNSLLESSQTKPSAMLEFTEDGHLGYVSYVGSSKSTNSVEVPMDRYLTKNHIFSRYFFPLSMTSRISANDNLS